MSVYRAPWWLRGGHAQTLYAALLAPQPRVAYRRERWETPDGDFVDVDWVVSRAADSQASGKVRDWGTAADSRVWRRVRDWGTAAHSRVWRRVRQWRTSAVGAPSAHPTDNVTNGVTNRAQPAPDRAPLVALFHGLEGCSASHYAHALMAEVDARGWSGVVVHFRGCSGAPNRLPRAYHSGDTDELDWMLRRLRIAHAGPLFAVGVSLGGNVLLKWLGERGAQASAIVAGAAAASAPIDLTAAGNALDRGFNLVYTRAFLRTLKVKSLRKLAPHPGLYDATAVRRAGTLRAFDNVVTAPLHGFRDTDDYWARASSKPWLARIAVRTLVINARDDPFLPAAALPQANDVSGAVTLDLPREGGHVGFVSGPFPGNLSWLPRRILDFFSDLS